MKDTKQRLIEVTARRIQEKGYFGTGISEILKEVNIPKGSLYHHFPGGKDELVIAGLDFSGKVLAEAFVTAMKGKKTAEEGLICVVDYYIEQVERYNFRYACPVATVALEVSNINLRIQKECQSILDKWVNNLEQYFQYKNADLTRVDAERFIMLIEGGLVLAKTYNNSYYLEKIKEEYQ